MAGGKGSRMGTGEKMLLEINGERVIDTIIKTLKHQNFTISLCISDNTEFLNVYESVRIIKGYGNYAKDLSYAISMCSLPVLIVPSDVIFPSDMLSDFIEKSFSLDTGIATLVVNGELSGISIFFRKPETGDLPYKNIEVSSKDFFNLNYPEDYRKAVEYFEK